MNRIKPVGNLLYTYQTTVMFNVYDNAIKGAIRLEHHYIPVVICRESLLKLEPIISRDIHAKVYSDPPFISDALNKWIK